MNTVKYLGILLYEHSHWSKELAYNRVKLNHRIVIISKLRHNTNLDTLKILYYSLFGWHLQYRAQLWGQANKKNQNKIQVIQNQALRKIRFKKLQLHKDLILLKFWNIFHHKKLPLYESNHTKWKSCQIFFLESSLQLFQLLHGCFSGKWPVLTRKYYIRQKT